MVIAPSLCQTSERSVSNEIPSKTQIFRYHNINETAYHNKLGLCPPVVYGGPSSLHSNDLALQPWCLINHHGEEVYLSSLCEKHKFELVALVCYHVESRRRIKNLTSTVLVHMVRRTPGKVGVDFYAIQYRYIR